MRNEPQHDHGDELECFIDLDMGNEFVDGDLNMLLEVNYCSGTLGFTKTVHPNLRAGSNRFSFDHWNKQSTSDIVQSLKPGGTDALKIKSDGRVFDGNTRIKVLQDRGFDVNSLPREVLR